MKRYRWIEPSAEEVYIAEDKNGPWVRYEDHRAILLDLARWVLDLPFACNECGAVETCCCAYDVYNLNCEAKIDCLAAK